MLELRGLKLLLLAMMEGTRGQHRGCQTRFAKQENMAKSSQKKGRHRMTFTEVAENHKSDEVWRKVEYFGMESEEADDRYYIM